MISSNAVLEAAICVKSVYDKRVIKNDNMKIKEIFASLTVA